MSRLAIVTATTNQPGSQACIGSWYDTAAEPFEIEVVFNGRGYGGYLGTVPAFRKAMDTLLDRTDAEVIACFHDDLSIRQTGWDQQVLRHFDRQPACGLAGFGGAIGLGAHDLYEGPYEPMKLARQGFRSNLVDAEAHGMRTTRPERVACLDGFSQIGRRAFWEGHHYISPVREAEIHERPWTLLDDLGIVHHFYDGMLGCLARRYGWEAWVLPVSCQHYGGRTAVGDRGYQDWAHTQVPGGDHDFWEDAHKIGYGAFKDVLPIRV